MALDAAALQRERRALDLFDAALTWPPGQREATLRTMCADDAALLGRVERLLAAQRDAHLMRTAVMQAAETPSAEKPAQPASAPAMPARILPDRIGVYRIAEPIGQGGMGTVHRAERIEGGFSQTVAIKLIHGGLFSRTAAERFAQEREILARLHHPHITRLYDGGATADGQSYIVMELVGGLPIDQHVEQRHLDFAARLALFGRVCDAVGYAHQQGVVHADIKPGNILVDPTHGPKLLDFGISAFVAADQPGGAGFTAAYASPQQRQGARPIPADDIFALGCLLSALTQGCTDTRSAELRAVIGMARAHAARDRYVSCGALADDVLRVCGLYPVQARPATRRRDLHFFWRRHRWAVSAATAFVLGLATAVVVSTAFETRAQAARVMADQRFVEIRALSRYLLDDVTDQLQAFPGTSRLRRDIATRSRTYLEGLSRLPDASPDIALEVARGYTTTGRILGLPDLQGMGDVPAAKLDLAKAEAILRALLAANPDPPSRARIATALAEALSARAAIARTVDNDTALSRRLYEESARLTLASDAKRPPVEQRLARARALLGVAELLDDGGNPAGMLAPLDAAAAELRDVPPAPDRVRRALTRSYLFNLRGDATYFMGNVAGSLAIYQQAAASLDGVRDAAPDIRLLERGAFTSWNIASVLDELGRKAEGLAVIERGVADAELMRLFENSTRARHIVDIVHTQRAQALASLGRFDEAIAQATAELADMRATAAASPGSFEAARAVPVILRPVGEIYLAAGRLASACAAFAEARRTWTMLAGERGLLAFDTLSELPALDRDMLSCQGKTDALPLRDAP